MMKLSDNHKRALWSTFRHVEGLFSKIEWQLESKGPQSSFEIYEDDLTPAQRKFLKEHIREIRVAMQEILDAKKIRIDPIPTSMHRMVSTGISFAGIAIEEFSAKYMRAYGELSKEAMGELEQIASHIQELLREMNACLESKSHGR